MKIKWLCTCLILSLVVILSSCRGDDGPMGPAGKDGKDGVVNALSYAFTVNQNDWNIIDNGIDKYFKYSFDFEELTADILEYGLLSVYLVMPDSENDYYGQLPVVRHYGEEVSGGNISYYTQTIDCEFSAGLINFFVTNSDFYIDDKPESMTFKLVCHY